MPMAAPSPSTAESATPRRFPLLSPWLVIVLLLLATVGALRGMGRAWWCACRQPIPFSTQVASSHNSQHLLDPYSLSHLLHGLIFFGVLRLVAPRIPPWWRLVIGVTVEAGWEVLENSPMVIERYRAATASLGYSGDSIVNSTGDVLSCLLGFWLARALGWWKSIALFVLVEVGMLLWIRDNLTLNVIMLLRPLDAIRRWQLGG